MGPSAQQAKELADELSTLYKDQSKALQSAVYIKMTKEEFAQYDKRATRIKQISTLLGKYKPL
jgi:hypothetical protein